MEKQFDSLSTYVSLAKKTISKLAPKFYNGLSTEMLKNEEAISDVATALMYADWRFDDKRTGKSGEKKTLYSYRNQCAIWAIKTYVTNKYKKKKNYSMDYQNGDNDQTMSAMMPDPKQKCPLDILIDEENTQMLSDGIDYLLSNNLLSIKQKQQIRMYYFEDATLSAIGKKFGVSREAVRQNIKRGLDIIKSHDHSKS